MPVIHRERADRGCVRAFMLAVVSGAVLRLCVANGLASDTDDLLRRGYRWVIVDGPYACVSVEDLRKITRGGGDELELKLVQELKAYYLIQGTVVQVLKEDKSAGVSQIHVDGITTPLWTRSDYLSRHPVKSVIGQFETPMVPAEQAPGKNGAPGETPMPTPSASATP
jgi:hypothetical protein